MSKSYDNCIYLSDSPDDISAKVKKAFTTPSKMRKTDPGIPEGCSVCQLRKLYDPANYKVQWDECSGGIRGCMQGKTETADVLIATLEPIRQKRALYESDPAELERILASGAEKAREVAEETMKVVRKAMRL